MDMRRDSIVGVSAFQAKSPPRLLTHQDCTRFRWQPTSPPPLLSTHIQFETTETPLLRLINRYNVTPYHNRIQVCWDHKPWLADGERAVLPILGALLAPPVPLLPIVPHECYVC